MNQFGDIMGMVALTYKVMPDSDVEDVSTDDVVAGFVGEIDSYIKACRNKLQQANTEAVDFQGFTQIPANLNLPNQSIYPLLANIFKGDAAGVNSFSTCLSVRPELSDTFKGCILYDEEMPNSLGEAATSIIIWNTVTLDRAIATQNTKKETVRTYINFCHFDRRQLQQCIS